MEYCEGGDLFEKIQQKDKLGEEETALIVEQVLYALNHCHSKNICHWDLKPENIVFTKRTKAFSKQFTSHEQPEVKIIDFGLAKYLIKS